MEGRMDERMKETNEKVMKVDFDYILMLVATARRCCFVHLILNARSKPKSFPTPKAVSFFHVL